MGVTQILFSGLSPSPFDLKLIVATLSDHDVDHAYSQPVFARPDQSYD